MINVQVFDPPMCCSTGICGPEVDPNIVQFAVLLSQLEQRGVAVERYNLGQQPMAFVQNEALVKLRWRAQSRCVWPIAVAVCCS
jgi:hypothetical protein